MTALSANYQRVLAAGSRKSIGSHGVLLNKTFYQGSLVCAALADGFAQPVVQSITNPVFLGIATHGLAAVAASGDAKIEVIEEGTLEVAAITGATAANKSAVVYAADDGTGLTLTDTNNVPIGRIENYENGVFHVFFQASSRRSI